MTHPARIRFRFSILLLALVTLLGACSSGETSTSTTTAPSTTAPTTTVATPSAEDVTAASFTEDWGCGYGFWTSNSDQTVAMLVQFSDFDAAAAGQVPSIGNVPSVIWSGQVQFGSDLMANWCNDVVTESDPTPIIDESWTIVGADITVAGDPPVQGCGPLTGQLSGIVIESPTGDRVSFDQPVAFENRSWGCFAG